MEQSTPQTVELSTDEQEQLKKSKVQEFIKRLETQEQDPKYRHMMDNFRRAQKDFNDFMKLPKEQRSKSRVIKLPSCVSEQGAGQHQAS